jgi:lysophospholipase L1-like esterase
MQPLVRRILALILCASLLAAAPASVVDAAGKPGSTTGWKYTALGDSLATGILAFSGYVPRYQRHITADTGVSVSLTNLGQNGWTSADLLNALRTNRKFRSSVKAAQVVTWDIGGNDLRAARESYKVGTCYRDTDSQDCLRAAVETFETNWNAIIVEILALRATSGTIIRTMDVYNPYVNEDKAANTWADDGGLDDFQVVKQYLDEVNQHIASTATVKGIPYAKVYDAFNGPNGDTDPSSLGYITFDGLHPSDNGHTKIAELLQGLGYAPLK